MTAPLRPEDWGDPVRLPEVPTTFARIMVPFDGSHAAEQALAYAAALAAWRGSEIVVAVAFDPPVTLRRRASLVLEDTRAQMEEEATALAEESVAALIARACTARGVVVRGDIVDALLQTIDDEGADIVIMGRHGLGAEVRAQRPIVGGMQAVVHGSVADKIARHATVPVLLVGA